MDVEYRFFVFLQGFKPILLLLHTCRWLSLCSIDSEGEKALERKQEGERVKGRYKMKKGRV